MKTKTGLHINNKGKRVEVYTEEEYKELKEGRLPTIVEVIAKLSLVYALVLAILNL